MIVCKVANNNDEVLMPVGFLWDRNLSLDAKGLLATLYAMPDDWYCTLKNITALCSDSICVIRSTILELEQMGYIERRMIKRENGRFSGVEYIIHEKPALPQKIGGDADDSKG